MMALWLLMMHNAVPHLHHKAMEWACEMEMESTVSPIEWLSELFHFNPGSDHLEHFRAASESSQIGAIQIDQFVLLGCPLELPLIFEINVPCQHPYLPRFTEDVLALSEPDRGPPAELA